MTQRVMTTVRLTPKGQETLTEMAEELKTTRSDLMRTLIGEALQNPQIVMKIRKTYLGKADL